MIIPRIVVQGHNLLFLQERCSLTGFPIEGAGFGLRRGSDGDAVPRSLKDSLSGARLVAGRMISDRTIPAERPLAYTARVLYYYKTRAETGTA